MTFRHGRDTVHLPEQLEEVGREVVDSAYEVHRQLGPGLLEGIYQVCLAQELMARGLAVDREVHVPLVYKGASTGAALRLDLLVGGQVVVETKAVRRVVWTRPPDG